MEGARERDRGRKAAENDEIPSRQVSSLESGVLSRYGLLSEKGNFAGSVT